MPRRTDSTQAPVDLDQQGVCNSVLYVMSSGRLSRNGEPKEYRRAICFREAIMYRRPTLKVSDNTLDAPRCWSLLARHHGSSQDPRSSLKVQQATMLVMLSLSGPSRFYRRQAAGAGPSRKSLRRRSFHRQNGLPNIKKCKKFAVCREVGRRPVRSALRRQPDRPPPLKSRTKSARLGRADSWPGDTFLLRRASRSMAVPIFRREATYANVTTAL
jgi:hypothetical protein